MKCGELHNGVIVIRLIVDGLSSAACGSNHLYGHLTFGIVIILNGVDNNLRCYDLAGELNIRLGSTDDS